MDQAQKFIYTRTYSRWLEDEGRREDYPETVDRYINFIKERWGEIVPAKVFKKMRSRMLELSVLPSMRALWAAGPAAKNTNVAMYNCAYADIDSVDAFAEALYILMCGTGYGFSVRRIYTEHLPEVPEINWEDRETHIVGDSKEGWATSLRALLKALYDGRTVDFDYSRLRPRGSRLKTFGGRASGPEPLIVLHSFVKEVFQTAQGRGLTSLECLDILNQVAEVVVVGGVRRSSEISLSDLDDDLVRNAKVWPFPQRRAMSNNSAVYTEKPTAIQFLQEWAALAASGTGERGIFNLEAVRACAPKRRDASKIHGTNPCKPLGSFILTSTGYITFKQALELGQVELVTPSTHGVVVCKPPFKTHEKAEVFKVKLSNGHYLYGTKDHSHQLIDGNWVKLGDLKKWDRLCLHNEAIYKDFAISLSSSYEDGLLCGWLHGDGWFTKRIDSTGYNVGMCFGDKEFDVVPLFEKLLGVEVKPHEQKPNTCKLFSSHDSRLSSRFFDLGVSLDKNDLTWVLGKSKEFKIGFLQAVFTADGSVRKQNNVELYSTRRSALEIISLVLYEFGIHNTICLHNNKKSYIAKDKKQRNNKTTWKINVPAGGFKQVGFLSKFKNDKLKSQTYKEIYRRKDYLSVVETAVFHSVEPVYDIQVLGPHCFVDTCAVAHNCSEIMLRSNQFCNLSEVVVRPDDDLDDLLDKVETATWIGAIQSTYTDFPFLSKKWRKNCEEERLLGVSLTGQMDNPSLLTPDALKAMKARALKVAKHAAGILKINVPTAVTCVKPSGTVSQLVNSASGVHPRYAPYYIRRYRIASTDPLCKLLRSQGIELHPENGQEDYPEDKVNTWVVSFPIKAPEGAVTRQEVNALDQLEWYKKIQLNWCEHNASTTIYVKNDEWFSVGNWVYHNWDIVNGVSFLPYDGGHYKQAPYEEISQEEYEKLVDKFPEIDYSRLSEFEQEDTTEGAKSYSCVGDRCELN